MARSYRKPYWTEGYGGTWRRFIKRHANKRIRRSKNVNSGMSYKRHYCSWMICDFKFHDSTGAKVRRK